MSTAEERSNTTSPANAPFHPFHPEHFAHPYERLKQAREHCPVGPFTADTLPGVPFYFLAQDVDVRAALNSSHLSNQGNFELANNAPAVITQMDGEEHTHLRTILEQSFNARIFKEARPFIVRKTTELLEAWRPSPSACPPRCSPT